MALVSLLQLLLEQYPSATKIWNISPKKQLADGQ